MEVTAYKNWYGVWHIRVKLGEGVFNGTEEFSTEFEANAKAIEVKKLFATNIVKAYNAGIDAVCDRFELPEHLVENLKQEE